MNNLEALSMFTTGIRMTVLVVLISVLVNSIRRGTSKSGVAFSKIAQDPRVLLAVISTLLLTSAIELTIELVDHWRAAP